MPETFFCIFTPVVIKMRFAKRQQQKTIGKLVLSSGEDAADEYEKSFLRAIKPREFQSVLTKT